MKLLLRDSMRTSFESFTSVIYKKSVFCHRYVSLCNALICLSLGNFYAILPRRPHYASHVVRMSVCLSVRLCRAHR